MNRLIIALAFTIISMGSAFAEPIVTESTTTSTVTTNGEMTTTVKSPPPSAISPQFSAGNNNDLCTVGVAGAVQTQILGISAGTTFTEENCVRLKKAKTQTKTQTQAKDTRQTQTYTQTQAKGTSQTQTYTQTQAKGTSTKTERQALSESH